MTRAPAAIVYPFLWAMVPVLFRAHRSPGYFSLTDLLLVTGAVLLLIGAVYAAAAIVLPGGGRPELPALCALLAGVWLFEFDPAARALPRLPHHLSYVLLAVVAAVVSAILIRSLAARPERLRALSVFLALSGGLLVGRFALGIVLDRRESSREVEASTLRRDLARPLTAHEVPGPARDIYLIVLDEYANADVLRTVFGFDNRPFLDSLRALGFHVPASVGSNYAHTTLSLPSLLNAAHVAPVARELPRGATDPTLMNRVLGESRVARFLRRRGYRYILFPSSWWGSSQASSEADSVVHVFHGFDLDRELGRSEFRRVIRRETVLDYLHRDEPWDAEFVRGTFEEVERLPSIEGPVFAFVHVLSPHWPYVFDRDCRTPRRLAGLARETAYIGQLQCLNALVLRTVGRLIRESSVPPVILLQGDHGSAMQARRMKLASSTAVEAVPASVAWERFGAFGAYYLPDGGAAAFGDTVTVVNVLGNVLRHYFGAELPREPDERYLSVEPDPFRFKRADPAWVAGGRAAAAQVSLDR